MAFVKLDCGILDSTLWFDRDARDIFVTALLMALPQEFTEPVPVISPDTTDLEGWNVPPGWYGFVPAAGPGIIRRAGGIEMETGLAALKRLAEPDPNSRTPDFDGRRLVRVDGGYIALNFSKHRNRDHTAAKRSRAYRERQRHDVTDESHGVASRDANPPSPPHTPPLIPLSEAEAENMSVSPKKRFKAPSVEEVQSYVTAEYPEFVALLDADDFVAFYESKGWMVGKSPMKSWKAAVHTWIKRIAKGGPQ